MIYVEIFFELPLINKRKYNEQTEMTIIIKFKHTISICDGKNFKQTKSLQNKNDHKIQ